MPGVEHPTSTTHRSDALACFLRGMRFAVGNRFKLKDRIASEYEGVYYTLGGEKISDRACLCLRKNAGDLRRAALASTASSSTSET